MAAEPPSGPSGHSARRGTVLVGRAAAASKPQAAMQACGGWGTGGTQASWLGATLPLVWQALGLGATCQLGARRDGPVGVIRTGRCEGTRSRGWSPGPAGRGRQHPQSRCRQRQGWAQGVDQGSGWGPGLEVGTRAKAPHAAGAAGPQQKVLERCQGALGAGSAARESSRPTWWVCLPQTLVQPLASPCNWGQDAACATLACRRGCSETEAHQLVVSGLTPRRRHVQRGAPALTQGKDPAETAAHALARARPTRGCARELCPTHSRPVRDRSEAPRGTMCRRHSRGETSSRRLP